MVIKSVIYTTVEYQLFLKRMSRKEQIQQIKKSIIADYSNRKEVQNKIRVTITYCNRYCSKIKYRMIVPDWNSEQKEGEA
ncbi:hypothetical protein [Sporolactobacillus terrae]|uniref:hypothetical protein n=1 Tax=Sporolactobacillus terrae TaxID=269673 RepID=UPI001CBE01D7|nr:hypothetical protein [Sporolactobacillus terrae]UAK17583.1 hypothetical protein K7399_06560 [Sporolactobacillus terrae]